LAGNLRKTIQIVRQVNPHTRLCVWSDMFDPHHNALKGPYYSVNGSYEKSWEGLDPKMTIVNRNHDKAARSLAFFDGLGCRQVLTGYCDGDPQSIAPRLAQAGSLSSVRGVPYTTWTNNYQYREAFAKAASLR
jgi:hypothetical protein